MNVLITAGRVSDYFGAQALLSSLPTVDWQLTKEILTPIGSGMRCKL